MPVAARRLEVGFEGGAVIRMTVPEDSLDAVAAELAGGSGWQEVSAEEGEFRLNLDKLVYTRVEPGQVGRVGFGNG